MVRLLNRTTNEISAIAVIIAAVVTVILWSFDGEL
jgi:hypothetical protein